MTEPLSGGRDVLTREQRSRCMSRIRGKNTRPEILIRKGLHARGLRFRLHRKDLPGKPDLVFPRYRTVLFVHGCFWHGHGCHLFRLPASRTDFWREKIKGNRVRDRQAEVNLIEQGWRVTVIWECALRGKNRRPVDEILDAVRHFIHNRATSRLEISSESVESPAKSLTPPG